MELGRLRRGILGVVGRGGGNNPTTQPPEDLPTYYLLSIVINLQTDF